MADALPAGLIPGRTSLLRARLQRTWEKQGRKIPEDIRTWPRRRLLAAWLTTLEGLGWDCSRN